MYRPKHQLLVDPYFTQHSVLLYCCFEVLLCLSGVRCNIHKVSYQIAVSFSCGEQLFNGTRQFRDVRYILLFDSTQAFYNLRSSVTIQQM